LRRNGQMLFVPVKLGRCCRAAAHDPGPRPGPSGASASSRVARKATMCDRNRSSSSATSIRSARMAISIDRRASSTATPAASSRTFSRSLSSQKSFDVRGRT
jgi:hypothetical protein